MAFYQVEGTSLVSWSLLVEGKSESEASAAAVRLAACLSDLRREHALRDISHQILGCRRVIATPAQDRDRPKPEAPRADE